MVPARAGDAYQTITEVGCVVYSLSLWGVCDSGDFDCHNGVLN